MATITVKYLASVPFEQRLCHIFYSRDMQPLLDAALAVIALTMPEITTAPSSSLHHHHQDPHFEERYLSDDFPPFLLFSLDDGPLSPLSAVPGGSSLRLRAESAAVGSRIQIEVASLADVALAVSRRSTRISKAAREVAAFCGSLSPDPEMVVLAQSVGALLPHLIENGLALSLRLSHYSNRDTIVCNTPSEESRVERVEHTPTTATTAAPKTPHQHYQLFNPQRLTQVKRGNRTTDNKGHLTHTSTSWVQMASASQPTSPLLEKL